MQGLGFGRPSTEASSHQGNGGRRVRCAAPQNLWLLYRRAHLIKALRHPSEEEGLHMDFAKASFAAAALHLRFRIWGLGFRV